MRAGALPGLLSSLLALGAAILTSRYAVCTGVRGALGSDARRGLPQAEVTLAADFFRPHRDRPSFTSVAFTMPHVPIAASAEFRGRSRSGAYGGFAPSCSRPVAHGSQPVADQKCTSRDCR